MRRAYLVAFIIGYMWGVLATPANAKQPGQIAWGRVAACESGGWDVQGSAYPDPFGISAVTWHAVHGHDLPVGSVSGSARRYAVLTANKAIRYIRAHYYAGQQIPDQTGCNGAW